MEYMSEMLDRLKKVSPIFHELMMNTETEEEYLRLMNYERIAIEQGIEHLPEDLKKHFE